MTKSSKRGIIRSVGPAPTDPSELYEVCLMLTRVFLGKEDKHIAQSLYRIALIKSKPKEADNGNSNAEEEDDRQ